MVATLQRGSSHTLSDGSTAATATLVGVLTRDDLPAQRRAISDLLGEAGAVIVDVSALGIQHASDVRIFRAALAAAGGWPSVRLVILKPRPRLAAALESTAVAEEVHVVDSIEDALRKLECRPKRVSRRDRLALNRRTREKARAVVGSTCRAWDVEHLARAAEAVVEEMVGEAVGLAHTRSVLTLSLDDEGLRIALRDFGSARTPGHARDPDRVRRLCDVSGVTPLSDGRVVWAVLTARPGVGASAPTPGSA